MTGIPSTAGAHWALRWVKRVLLRIALLAGMIICGWLLGAGTGLADEDRATENRDRFQRAGGPATGEPARTLPGAARLAETNLNEVLPATETVTEKLAVPAPRQVPDLMAETAEPVLAPVTEPVLALVVEPVLAPVVEPVLAPVVEPVLAPVTEPVTRSVTPAPADQQAPPRTTSGPDPPAAAAPVAAPVPAGPVMPLPQPDQAARSGTPDAAANPTTHRSAGVSVAGSTPAPVTPARPSGPAATPCPAGPSGSGPTAPGAHAGTVDDGLTGADVALPQHRGYSGAGGLPQCPGGQPATSPD